jgi:hypothetical protein
VIEIRTSPPENLQRTPGPRTILYYLKRDADLQAQGIVPPTSTRTIWKILRQLGYILDPPEHTHKPLPPLEPLQEVQMDFKDATTVPADPRSASSSMWSKCSTLSMLAPPSCSALSLMLTFMLKRLWML